MSAQDLRRLQVKITEIENKLGVHEGKVPEDKVTFVSLEELEARIRDTVTQVRDTLTSKITVLEELENRVLAITRALDARVNVLQTQLETVASKGNKDIETIDHKMQAYIDSRLKTMEQKLETIGKKEGQ